jgi:uncharacterized damage-inducible protein DinB
MKQYLVDFFKYNDWANRKLLETIKELPDKEEAIMLFSHFITSQDKWLNRITKKVDDNTLTWFNPIFPLHQLESKWKESLDKWIGLIEDKNDSEIENNIEFNRVSDGKKLAVKIRDIVLQLNYHSIHHRAQINRIIRQQGLTPPATDYIFTALKEV